MIRYIEEVDLLCGGERVCKRCVNHNSCYEYYQQRCSYLLYGLDPSNEDRMDLILDIINSTMDENGRVDYCAAALYLHMVDKYSWMSGDVIVSLLKGGYWVDAFIETGKRLRYSKEVVTLIRREDFENFMCNVDVAKFNRCIDVDDNIGAVLQIIAPDISAMPRGYRLARSLQMRSDRFIPVAWACLFGCSSLLYSTYKEIPKHISKGALEAVKKLHTESQQYVPINDLADSLEVYEYFGRVSSWMNFEVCHQFMEVVVAIVKIEHKDMFRNYIRHWFDVVEEMTLESLMLLAGNYRGQALSVHPSQIALADTEGHNDSLLKAELELGMLLNLPRGWNVEDVPVLVDTEIPQVELQSGEYKLRRLDRNGVDVYRGLFLGLYTNCCQHPDGAGSFCAFHGTENPLGGFYVVEKRGKIQAQAWAWIDKETSTLVLDNVECLGDLRDSVKNLFVELADVLANKFRVVVGLGYSDVNWSEYPDDNQQLVSISGMGYTDARTRKVLAERRAL